MCAPHTKEEGTPSRNWVECFDQPFSHGGITHSVFCLHDGTDKPPVLLLHELTGLSPGTLAYAEELSKDFTVYVPLLFGEGHRAASPLVAAMMLGLPLTCHGRLIAPALHAHDHPAVNTAAGALRLASLALGGASLLAWMADPLLAVAMAWAVSEAIATAWVLLVLRRLARRGPQGTGSPGEATP